MTVCEYCKKAIVKGDEFIVVGIYPKAGYIFHHSSMKNYVPPETWGKIFHKGCFLESLKKEGMV